MKRFRTLAAMVSILAVPILAGAVVSETRTHAAEPTTAPTPDRVVAMWREGLRMPSEEGEPSIRGLFGVVLFYVQDQPETVKADGRLEVFVFDETEHPETVRPTRKYIWPQEVLPKYHTVWKHGHKYIFWLPWGPVGEPEVRIRLVVRFIPAEGGIVVGDDCREVLLGEMSGPQDAAEKSTSPYPKKRRPRRRVRAIRR